jgi:hypothetical protein
VKYSRSGIAIEEALIRCLIDYGIKEKMFTITLDNASNNKVLSPYSGRAKSGSRSKTGLGKGDGRITDRVPYGCLGPVKPCKLRLRQLGFVSCLVRVS